jgi:PiT family inorganic phosphate transporter
VGSDLVASNRISMAIIISAMLAAISWKTVTWYFGLPSSSSHSLFGGLIGAVIVGAGSQALIPAGLRTIVIALLLSPLLGLVGGYLMMSLTLFLVRNATPRINTFFRRGQWLTAVALALTHGSNNAQKLMGILGLGLLSSGLADKVASPLWITASAAGALALGTFFGGSRLMHTVGARFYKIRPVHGFTAQLATAVTILGATLLGGPVSTTQVASSTIVGVGASERMSKVRWGVFKDIALAWLVTLPATGLLAIGFYFPVKALVEWLS